MNALEIKPKQIRALLLLLVLVPLIPTVLMIRFVLDAVSNEQASVIEHMKGTYSQTLQRANGVLINKASERQQSLNPQEVHNYIRSLYEPQIGVRVLNPKGQLLVGQSVTGATLLTRYLAHNSNQPWNVELWLLDGAALAESAKSQAATYFWMIGLSMLAIFSITAAAGVALNQHLTLHELKNTTLATVAHELRTPLASMRMLVDTLREGRCRSEEQKNEYLDLITQENLRLSRLTDNFLTLSRLEHNQHPFQRQLVNPRQIAEDSLQTLRAKLALPNVSLRLALQENPPPINVDRDAMVTVLTNLLENAVKYSGDDKQLGLELHADQRWVSFRISDNGIGIAEAEQKNIFKAFHQVDQKLARTREGCGLGLSLVKKIIEAHGGTISLESSPLQGSTFTVNLPVADSTRPAS